MNAEQFGSVRGIHWEAKLDAVDCFVPFKQVTKLKTKYVGKFHSIKNKEDCT